MLNSYLFLQINSYYKEDYILDFFYVHVFKHK